MFYGFEWAFRTSDACFFFKPLGAHVDVVEYSSCRPFAASVELSSMKFTCHTGKIRLRIECFMTINAHRQTLSQQKSHQLKVVWIVCLSHRSRLNKCCTPQGFGSWNFCPLVIVALLSYSRRSGAPASWHLIDVLQNVALLSKITFYVTASSLGNTQTSFSKTQRVMCSSQVTEDAHP